MAEKTDPRISILVRMPPKLKRAVVREVKNQASNMNDVCVGIISEYYDEPFEPTNRRAGEAGDAGDVVLRITQELKDKIVFDAAPKHTNIIDTCVRVLAESLNVKVVIPPGRRSVPFGGGRRSALSGGGRKAA